MRNALHRLKTTEVSTVLSAKHPLTMRTLTFTTLFVFHWMKFISHTKGQSISLYCDSPYQCTNSNITNDASIVCAGYHSCYDVNQLITTSKDVCNKFILMISFFVVYNTVYLKNKKQKTGVL